MEPLKQVPLNLDWTKAKKFDKIIVVLFRSRRCPFVQTFHNDNRRPYVVITNNSYFVKCKTCMKEEKHLIKPMKSKSPNRQVKIKKENKKVLNFFKKRKKKDNPKKNIRTQREYEFAKQKRAADKFRKNLLKKQKLHQQNPTTLKGSIHEYFKTKTTRTKTTKNKFRSTRF